MHFRSEAPTDMNQLLEIDAAKEGKVGKLIRASSREMASFICVLQQSGSIISGGSLLDLNNGFARCRGHYSISSLILT